ncbi:WXG100 family type VII secretion target [Streptosporangium sp. NPDC023825]|uniref:WXG100 family type VII secretion target n=1 Tax=Streptosporangium sp. NPDC023825 TaxID=3154909 RepID=UPI00341F106F
MVQKTSASHSRLGEASQKTDDAKTTINQIKTQLEGHRGELRSGWDGQSAVSFDGVFNAWSTEMTNILRELEGLSVKLKNIQKNYETAQENQTAVSRRLGADINS